MSAIENTGKRVEISEQKTKQAALAFIFTVILMDLIGLTILIPVTPYIVGQYSSQAVMVTLMTVLYAAAQFTAAPLLGRLSDRYGRRPVLLLCILGSAVGYFLFGIGGALWVLFLSRLIDGFTGGNISTASAYIADVTQPHERAKAFGFLGAAFGLGFILGPALGGALSQIHVTAPAFVAGGLSLLSAVVGFFLLPESLPKVKRTKEALQWKEINPFSAILQLLRRAELTALLYVQAIFNFVAAGFNSLAPVFLMRTFKVSPLQIAGILVVAGITNVIVQAGFIGRLVERFGERKLAVASLLAQAIQVAGIAVIPSFWMMYPFIGLSSGAAGPFRPASSALLANRVQGQEQGKLNGVSTSLASLMSVFGPLLAGLAYDKITPAAPFWVGSILLILTSAWLSSTFRQPSGWR